MLSDKFTAFLGGAMERLIRASEILKVFPVSKTTLWRLRRAGVLPKPVRLSARIVAWPESQIAELIERCKHEKPTP